MSIGLGIFLIVVGAILTFAIHVTVASIDLALVGWILMAAGVVVVGLGIFFTLSLLTACYLVTRIIFLTAPHHGLTLLKDIPLPSF